MQIISYDNKPDINKVGRIASHKEAKNYIDTIINSRKVVGIL
jgi:hypothetical protein